MPSADSIVIDHSDWDRVRENLKNFPPTFKRELRRNIRAVTEDAAVKVRESLALPSPGGGPDDTGGRAALIAGTRVSVSFRAASVSAAIVTSSSKLDPKHKGLLKVYNMEHFRHPVFARTMSATVPKGAGKRVRSYLKSDSQSQWVEQEGRPYFGKIISTEMKVAAVVQIRAALQEALAATGAK